METATRKRWLRFYVHMFRMDTSRMNKQILDKAFNLRSRIHRADEEGFESQMKTAYTKTNSGKDFWIWRFLRERREKDGKKKGKLSTPKELNKRKEE